MRGKGLIVALLAALVGTGLPAAAVARVGDLYIGDPGTGSVLKMNPRTGAVDPIVTGGGLITPDGVAFDRRGNLFITDYDGGPMNDGAVFKLNPRTEVLDPVLLGGGLEQPLDLVVGPDRRLYVSDLDALAVFKLNPANGAIDPLVEGNQIFGDGPLGIDRAPTGTLYTVDGQAAMGSGFGVLRVRLGTGAHTPVASGPNPSDAYGFAVAPNGKTAWVADSQFNQIYRVNLRTHAVTLLNTSGTPIAGPTALALAPNGNLLVANFDDQNVLRLNTRTGVAAQVGVVTGNAEGITLEPPRCGGLYATVVGTTGRDRIKGSRFGDVIATLGGRDTVRGLGGNDIICTGKGRDRLLGGGGRDRLLAGPGPDVCVGGSGRDRERGC